MKAATDALKDYLKNSRIFHSCDLYELTLLSGESYRYADYDMNVGAGGLLQAAWAATGTVSGGGNREIQTALSFPAGYYDQGTLQWLTGANAGTISSIKSSGAGRISLLVAPEAAISEGDTFRVYPGCDKSVASSRDKFNNLSNNRATPFVPLKETLI